MKMVRTSLIAAAAGVLISPALMAADVEGPSLSAHVSSEYLSTAVGGDVISHPSIGFEMGAEYAVGDVVDLTFTGNALDDTTLPTSVLALCDGIAGLSGVTYGLLSSAPGLATYRVTELDTTCGGTSTVGQSIDLTGAGDIDFDAQAVDAANGVTMSFSAQTGTGLPLDTGGGDDRSTDLWLTDSQFDATVPMPADNIIDVNTDRTEFTTGLTEMVAWDVDDFATPDDAEAGCFLCANPLDQDVEIFADLAFLIDQDDVTSGLQPDTDVINFANCDDDPDIGYDAASLTTTCGFGTSTLFVDLTDNVDGAGDLATLNATPFSSTHVINYEGINGTASSITVVNVDLGAWGLNGFQSSLSYTPYGTGISQVIYLANRGSQAGEVTVDYVAQDGTSGSLGVVATLQPTSTLSIGPAIQALLPAALQNFGRLALTITVNVPACDAQINAQYNAGGNRAYTSSRDNCEWDGGSF